MASSIPTRFRFAIQSIVPPWLTRFYGQRLLYSFGLLADAGAQAVIYGLRAAMPGIPEQAAGALKRVGDDRRIAQGPDEPDDHYAGRLQRAFETWQRAGSAEAVMRQGQLFNAFDLAMVVSYSGTLRTWWLIASEGADVGVFPIGLPEAWDWDSLEPGDPHAGQWSRCWLVLHVDDATWPRWDWGDMVWGSGAWCWGAAVPSQRYSSLLKVVRQWKSAATRFESVILSYDPAWPDPSSGADPSMPDGRWWRYSDGAGAPVRYELGRYSEPVA